MSCHSGGCHSGVSLTTHQEVQGESSRVLGLGGCLLLELHGAAIQHLAGGWCWDESRGGEGGTIVYENTYTIMYENTYIHSTQ